MKINIFRLIPRQRTVSDNFRTIIFQKAIRKLKMTCTSSFILCNMELSDLSGRSMFMRIMVVKMPKFFGNLIKKVLKMN